MSKSSKASDLAALRAEEPLALESWSEPSEMARVRRGRHGGWAAMRLQEGSLLGEIGEFQ